MVNLIDSGVFRPQRRGFGTGANGSAGGRAFRAALTVDLAAGRDADNDTAARPLPAALYRRISFTTWSAAMAVGALSWTAFFHLV